MARSRSTNVQSLTPGGPRHRDIATIHRTILDQVKAGPAVFARHARDVFGGERRTSVAGDHGERERQATAGSRQTADRLEHAAVFRERATQQRSPWEVDRELVCERIQRKALEGLAEQDEVRDASADGTTCRIRKRIRGCIETDREGVRSGARYMEWIAPITRAGVDHRARERAGELGDLTDVDVEEALADELSHAIDAIGVAYRPSLGRFAAHHTTRAAAARPVRRDPAPASPVQVDAQTRVVKPARPTNTCSGLAGLLRSDGRVMQELSYLLRAAAGNGDLGSPLQRLLA